MLLAGISVVQVGHSGLENSFVIFLQFKCMILRVSYLGFFYLGFIIRA